MTARTKSIGRLLATALVLSGLVTVPASATGTIYWSEAPWIKRADLDGSNVEVAVNAPGSQIFDIALDRANGKIYWAGTGGVARASLDGSAVEPLVPTVDAWGIALDLDQGHVYWSEFVEDKLQRADLDGSNMVDLVVGLDQPKGIALDLGAGKIYWSNAAGSNALNRKIQRADLDGGNVEDLLSTSGATGIALDLAAGTMYFTTQKINRANLDGSGGLQLTSDLEAPQGIALHVATEKMYWVDLVDRQLRRADLDGSQVEDLVAAVNNPRGVALDLAQPAPATGRAGMLAIALLLIVLLPLITSRN